MHTPHTYTAPFQVPCSLSGSLLSLLRTVRKGLMHSTCCLQWGDGMTYHRSIWELSSETFAQFAWALGLEPLLVILLPRRPSQILLTGFQAVMLHNTTNYKKQCEILRDEPHVCYMINRSTLEHGNMYERVITCYYKFWTLHYDHHSL